MLTMKDIQALSQRPVRTGNAILTVYLNVDQSRQANLNRGFETQLASMLTDLRTSISDAAELAAFDAAAKRVASYAAAYKIGARGLAAVFDVQDKFFFGAEIQFPLENQIRWSREVFIQPLAVAVDEYERVGIVVINRASVRLLTMFLGEIDEPIHEDFDRRKVRRVKASGTDHRESADQNQRKADEHVKFNLRRTIDDIDAFLEKHSVGRIILAGAPRTTAEFRLLLPKRLESRVIGVVDVAANASPAEICRIAAPAAERFERTIEEGVVRDLTTSAAKAARVVAGLSRTLNAVNHGRVWELVLAEGFTSPGYECSKCGGLFSAESTVCPDCGADVYAIEDVIERAAGHAMRRGARVEIIRDEDALAELVNIGGIGAFLRTRTPGVQAS
jgi:peptide subunit release factor 1 (eRF1)